MASIKISELNPATQLSSSDVLPVVSNGETKNCNLSVLRDGMLPNSLLLYYLTTSSSIDSLQVTTQELTGLSAFVTENIDKPIGVIIKSSSTQQISGIQNEVLFLPLNIHSNVSGSGTTTRACVKYNYWKNTTITNEDIIQLYPVNISYTTADGTITITSIRQNNSKSTQTLATQAYADSAANLTKKAGYDATKNQVLKNVEGTIKWVNE